MIIKFQILKSLVIETVKSTTFMKGKIDESAGDAATQKVSYHETAGDDETHERMLTLDFDTALEKLKTLFVDYLVPTAQTVGDNVIYYQEGKDDIVTFTLQVSRRFNGTLTDTLARISAKYVTDYMLYQWWLKTGNMKQAEPYVSFLSIDETEIRRCFVLCRPTVPTVPYTQSLTAKVDGSDSMEGLLTNVGPGAGKIAEPGKYKLTLNMMDYSYTIEPVNYDPFIYFIGSTDGWGSSDQKLALVDDEKGTYTGYIYLADPNNAGFEFKFQRVAGNWDNAIGASNFVTFKDAAIDANNGNNLGVNAGEGVYYMDVNLSEGTITATKVESMGMVGQFQGWDKEAPVPMTWNAEEYCFEATMAGVTADGWKFIVNKDWSINLGGSINNLEQDGANLTVAGNTIKLYPTRKTKDNIFCTVE